MQTINKLETEQQNELINRLMARIRKRNFEMGYAPLTQSEMLDAIAEVLYGVKSHKKRTSRLVFRK